ncbi:MAG TPA: DUF4349 domain-containing protein, partial [Roseiflexaceae bacterium]|nr:DUF4349 domain-containing protein [Roseiflexaceae bacterium]
APGGAPALDQGGVAQERPQGQVPASQRLVIRNASLSLQVENVREAEASVRAKAAELGGYVVSSQTNGEGDYMTAVVVFRVPAAQFDAALSGVQGLAKKVLSRNVSGEDVTEEYVDLESRLRTLEATRDRLLDLLAKAQTVEDALSVNSALTDVQGQVEQIKGRMQYLRQSAALSTISVELHPVPVTPIVVEDAWQPLQVARGALRDLLEFGQGLVNLAIVLLIWTPVWLPLVLFLRWGFRKLTRGGRKQPAPAAPPTEA